MADIIIRGAPKAADDTKIGNDPANERHIALAELLFFAYRDFTRDGDLVLAEFGFGRAHHRVLHFVDRYPGLRVADLLEILKITKQSLARVLRQLIEDGFIEQRADKADKRARRLFTTAAGSGLAARLLSAQIRRLSAAATFANASKGATIETFLAAMISDDERERVQRLMGGGPAATAMGR